MRYDDRGNLLAVYGPNAGRPSIRTFASSWEVLADDASDWADALSMMGEEE